MDIKELLKKPSFIGKIMELVLAISAVVTLQDSRGMLMLNESVHQMALVYMVYCGYLLILPMYIIGRLMGVETPKALEMAWALVGGILWIGAGGLLLKRYIEVVEAKVLLQNYFTEFLISAIIGIFNGLFFFLEFNEILKRE